MPELWIFGIGFFLGAVLGIFISIVVYVLYFQGTADTLVVPVSKPRSPRKRKFEWLR